MEEAKRRTCYKRLINKQFVQVSGLCDRQFLSYLPKCFTHLWRAFYGDVILVYTVLVHQYGRRQQKHLALTFSIKAFLLTRELAYVRINISSNTWNGYTAQNQEERLFFSTRQHSYFGVTNCENSEVQIAVFSKWRMLREWKLVQRFTFCLSSTLCT